MIEQSTLGPVESCNNTSQSAPERMPGGGDFFRCPGAYSGDKRAVRVVGVFRLGIGLAVDVDGALIEIERQRHLPSAPEDTVNEAESRRPAVYRVGQDWRTAQVVEKGCIGSAERQGQVVRYGADVRRIIRQGVETDVLPAVVDDPARIVVRQIEDRGVPDLGAGQGEVVLVSPIVNIHRQNGEVQVATLSHSHSASTSPRGRMQRVLQDARLSGRKMRHQQL